MKFSRWIIIAVSSLLLIHAARQLYTITFWPFQIEYREAAVASSTYEFLSGRNPFAFEEQPNYTNVYGLMFPIVSAAVAIAPENSFVAARITSAVFIILNCTLIFFWIKRKTSMELGLSAAALFFYHQLSASGAFPMSLGIFFSIVPIFLIDVYGFSGKLLTIGFLCSLLGFLTKPYFIVTMAWLGLISLLSVPIRKALVFAGLSAVGFIGAVLVTNKIFPAYFNNVIFAHLAAETWDTSYLVSQLQFYFHEVWAVLLSVALAGTALVLLKKMQNESVPPLAAWGGDPSLIAALGGLFVFCAKLGGHTGAAPASYLYDLFSPFFLVVTAKLFHSTSLMVARQNRFWGAYCGLLLSGSILVSCLSMPGFFQEISFSTKQMEDWQSVRDFIVRSETPLVSPSMASIILQNRRPLYDSGMSEYFSEGGMRSGWIRLLFPANPVIAQRQTSFLSEIELSIIHQRFDLVALTADYSPLVNLALVRKYYDLCLRVNLAMPFADQEWGTEIYSPKQRTCKPLLSSPTQN